MRLNRVILIFILAFSLRPAGAAVYIVDGSNPAAKDDNPGTPEAPFRSIQAGVAAARKAGDTVRVRAGIYRETVRFAAGGDGAGNANYNPATYLTLEAEDDQRVILDGSAEIPADQWQLVEGRTNTYVAAYPGPCRNQIYAVFVDGQMAPPALVPNPQADATRPKIAAIPADDVREPCFFHDVGRKQLYVNLAGKVPGRDVRVEPIMFETGIILGPNRLIRVRKLELRRFNYAGIETGGAHDPVIEDCHMHHCGQGIAAWGLSAGRIRRNTMHDLFHNGISMTAGRAVVVDNNVIRRFHLNPYQVGNAYVSSINMVGGQVLGNVIRNNIIADLMSHSAGGGGPWPDCGGAGMLLYGNSVVRVGMGFYIEAGTFGCTLRWNAVCDNVDGIVVRANSGHLIQENLVWRNRRMPLAAGSLSDGHPDALFHLNGNTFFRNWIIENRGAVSPTPSPAGELNCVFDHNIYKRLEAGGLLFHFKGQRFVDLGALREALGIEMHGREVAEFDAVRACGLATFRLADTRRPWEPIPMFANPDMSRWDLQESTRLYFWRRGTFREELWQHDQTAKKAGGGWPSQGWPFTWPGTGAYAAQCTDGQATGKSHDETHYLEIGSIGEEPASADGYGVWSAALPTVDGAVMDVSLFVRGENLKAAAPAGGVYAFVEFRDERGQNAAREFLIGAPDGGPAQRPELTTGTYPYTEVKAAVTAPAGARWFQLAFGVRNCTGKAQFDTVNIQTRPGAEQPVTSPDPLGNFPPVTTKAVVRPKAIDAAAYRWTPADLTPLLNRPLADDAEGDGQGGWFDLGPKADLRNLPAGTNDYAGVPFRIESGKACFIAKSRFRKSDNLPEGGRVELKGKADVIAFLHTGGWMGEAGVRHAAYVLHYADGTCAELPVVAGRNIFDWIAPPEVANDVPYDDALGFVTHAGSVNTTTFPSVHLWVVLWKNPHPEQELAAFEVRGANEGIAGLLGLSLGRAKD